VYVVSADITADEHVRMQAALQAFVDNSLSKTVNFSANATADDVARAYLLAWELGCKGITVYVTGSREKVVLETHATKKQKEQPVISSSINGHGEEQLMIWHNNKKPRPKALKGYTYSSSTPIGKAFVTVNENGGSQPFEIFLNTAKAGSETAAVSEAIGRLISYILRMASPVEPRERLRDVIEQLSGIGGGRPLGFGPNRVRSLPDGVAKALLRYMDDTLGDHAGDHGKLNGRPEEMQYSLDLEPIEPVKEPAAMAIGDLCPECGEAAVVNEEGCRKCYACAYSEC
jgi:ribonucleoside-diphosphate reductase alpha chain